MPGNQKPILVSLCLCDLIKLATKTLRHKVMMYKRKCRGILNCWLARCVLVRGAIKRISQNFHSERLIPYIDPPLNSHL